MLNLRPSPIASTWYEANPKNLADYVDKFLDAAQIPDLKGQIIAVIAPHAGHMHLPPCTNSPPIW